MTQSPPTGALVTPPRARPALLAGHWLGCDEGSVITAANPVSVLEGKAEVFGQFSPWLMRNAELYPEGAAIGYLAYELAEEFEHVPVARSEGPPAFSFAYYPMIDKHPRSVSAPVPGDSMARAHVVQDFDREQWVADVERIRDYIAAGDIYQSNLTQRFVARLEGVTPKDLHIRLTATRAPMSTFLQTPNAAVVSNSPERFFQVRGNRILASPIKGTIARSGDPIEDARVKAQLLASAKDRAENVMIVDLLRNDLGRVCHYESINARLWEIDEMPHLYHLVSHVEGQLRPEVDPGHILRALFPCGSITGAPKIRAMEILAEIEGVPRGVSMGAIGIITGRPGSPEFEMDFNVAIRTITIQGEFAVFNVGCGIVYDSKPEAEYEELLLKASPLLRALGIGSSGGRRRAG